MGRSRHTRGLLRETPVKEQERGRVAGRKSLELDASLVSVRAGKDGEEARRPEAPTAGSPGPPWPGLWGPRARGLLEGSQEADMVRTGTLCARLSAGSLPECGLPVEAGWDPWAVLQLRAHRSSPSSKAPLERGRLPAPGCSSTLPTAACPQPEQEKHLHGAHGPLLRRRPGEAG